MVNRWTLIVLHMVIILPAARGIAVGAGQPTRPNVLVILADDLGLMDVTPFNPDTFYETPNIQRLADTGMKFTDAYVANPVCSPSRFSLLTGKYPSRHDATDWFCGKRVARFRHAKYNCFMPVDETTVAEAFHAADYPTFFAGKWHLGPQPKHWPKNQGFDINKGGYKAGAPYYAREDRTGYFSPYRNPRLSDGPRGEYLPFRLAEETSRFIENHEDEPFFAFLSFYEVHNPRAAPKELIQKYKQKRERLGLGFV
jgi:arylsulfatase A-like enzyme